MAGGRLGVHVPAAPRVDRHVAVRPEGLGRDPAGPVAVRAARGERPVERGGRAGARLGLEPATGRSPPRHELDDAAQGPGAVEVRRPAPQHLDALEGEAGHSRPVDPAAERVVEREAVGEDEGAARPARPEPPQRHALGGGVGGAAAGAAEEGEAGDLPQRVVHGGGGGRVEGGAGHDGDARGRVGDPRVAARRGDRDLLREPRGGLGGRLLLRAGGDRELREGHGEGRDRPRAAQRTVTGIWTSVDPRRHHASRVEQ